MTAAQTIFHVTVTLVLALAAPLLAVGYFRRYRLPRPPVGVFNGRDIAVMVTFVVVMPFAYLALPGWGLPVVLGLVFYGSLVIGYEPVVRRRWTRHGLVLALLGADLLAAHAMSAGWAAPLWYGLVNSVLILLVVVSATNLASQGGLRLAHAAAFALALACYDAFFATVVPMTQRLAEAITGYAFAPSAGLVVGSLSSWLGMGDLLVYGMYGVVAVKAYGRRGLVVALVLIASFGAAIPAATPAVWQALTGTLPSLVPAQIFFGPAAFLGYLALRRTGPERRMAAVLTAPGPRVVPA
ncbi:MAG: hypothetical protein IRY92_00735 [Dactylosporangium sp.]|nr:hypothetical protein [Dactylosporangium sp.]